MRPSTCAADARAPRAKLATLGPRTMEGHCMSKRPPFLRRQALCYHVHALPLIARGGFRVWRACAPLRSLSLGTRPSKYDSDARARRAKPATVGPYTMERRCTSQRPPSLRRLARSPTCQRSSHCVWWVARVARSRATAITLSGDEAQQVRFRRARTFRVNLAALDPRTIQGHCTRERPPFLRRLACAPTCQHCHSPCKVTCACSALAHLCDRSLLGRGPARALPTRARAMPSRDTLPTQYGRALHER